MATHDQNLIPDNYLSLNEAAAVIGVNPGTAKKLCRSGELNAKMEHGKWVIPSDIVHSFAKQYKRPRRK